jgi:hypothetical protein
MSLFYFIKLPVDHREAMQLRCSLLRSQSNSSHKSYFKVENGLLINLFFFQKGQDKHKMAFGNFLSRNWPLRVIEQNRAEKNIPLVEIGESLLPRSQVLDRSPRISIVI